MRLNAVRTGVIAIFLIAACARICWATASFDSVKQGYKPSDRLILARDGEIIQRLRTDNTVRRGQWVTLADVSPALRTALVLSEDKRFYEHSGVDWRAVSSAAWANLWNTKTRGASTISMQLAGLLDDNLRAGAGGRSVGQKIGQTLSTQVLEASWRKDQILEAYLNLVSFRGELVGIDALSRTLFGKAANGLDEREAAVAAALVRGPNAKVAQVSMRACGVLKLMQKSDAPTLVASRIALPPEGASLARGGPSSRADCESLDLFTTGALQRKAFDAIEGIAPHLARRLVAQEKGQAAQSTLRAPLQRFAVQTLQQHLRELRGRHVEDGAVVVLDNSSGEVLAWVGSSGELSRAADVDGVTALRQPGSTLKPFLYAQAIAEQRLTAASLLEDSPTQINTASGLYIPQNYDRQFKGWVSVRTALASSLNVPAVRALVMVSPDAFARQLRSLGLPLKEGGDYYGYSLALGSAEVSLLTLTNAYRALGNRGRFSQVVLALPPSSQPSPARAPTTPSTATALDPRAAFIISDILADPNARARTFGTDSVLATRFWTAVKTGTSKDMRDNWALGYSQRYTVGVWVGNASGAAPIWAALMNHLHAREPSQVPVAPAGLAQAHARFDSPDGSAGTEAARAEWFIRGTEQTEFAMNSIAASANNTRANGTKGLKNAAAAAEPGGAGTAWIASPANGTIVALDPDIPPQRQRLSFHANLQGHGGLSGTVRWQIDGKDFARGPRAQWLPWPGRHRVQLLDGAGQVLDEVRIEVRGAAVKAATR